jgi:hypothetical protein
MSVNRRTFTITPFRSRQYATYGKIKNAKMVSFPFESVKHNLLYVLEQGTHVDFVLGGTPVFKSRPT